MQLVEEAIEGCWIGHRARMSSLNDSEIGSLYSPPRQDRSFAKTPSKHVEIVVEIGEREQVRLVPSFFLSRRSRLVAHIGGTGLDGEVRKGWHPPGAHEHLRQQLEVHRGRHGFLGGQLSQDRLLRDLMNRTGTCM